jgi:predicted molibdopterin-dependent oxidoreductase YjgC
MVFREISQAVPQYSDMTYRSLARSVEQWPKVGGEDLYYGGTAYDNQTGIGQQWAVTAESNPIEPYDIPDTSRKTESKLTAVQIPALYQPGTLVNKSDVIASRIARPVVFIPLADAERLSISDGATVSLQLNGMTVEGSVYVNGFAPAGTIMLRGTKAVPGNGLIAVQDIKVKD